ncbi:7939_t:CDS:2 [Dentiscutata erythropus]|uniref:7939_t:CDS:1 n=1 Tax=Dentiscutata erythropus TaxID=1348616 RepID=A0A9N9GI19_9GLOM|nr:7939_t:CDS:2 [Dentiscutata erythropus]
MFLTIPARRIKNILHAFGISKDDFSKNGVQSVKILATLATILELGDIERSSFLSAIAQLSIDSSHIERQNRDTLRTINSLEISTQEAKLRYHKLREILTNLRRNWDTKEDQKLKEWKRNTTLLDQKAKEYQLKLSRLERQYAAMNIEGGGLRFQDLKSKEEQIEALEKSVKDKTKKLKVYQILPPDVVLAKLQLDVAQQKLAELTETRDELLKQMAINLQQ